MRRPGRKLFYGKPLVKQIVRMVPELQERLEREAISRNVRDGSQDRWWAARVAHEDLAKLYGIELHPGGEG